MENGGIGPRSTGQQLRQVHRFHRRPGPAQSPLDVHQAADIAAGNGIGAGGNNVAYFVVNHGNGYFRVFNRKRTPETAAFVCISHLNQFCAFDLSNQTPRLLGDTEPS